MIFPVSTEGHLPKKSLKYTDMKSIIIFLLLFLPSLSLVAQLRNSRWKGAIRGDNPRDAILDFHKDSVVLYALSDGAIIERMTCTVRDGVIALHKIDGQSDCDNSVVGKYKFEIKGGFLFIRLFADPCTDRSSALDSTKWSGSKDHPEARVK